MNITGNFTEDTLKTLWKVNKENTELKQELQRKDNEIKQLQEAIVNHIKIIGEYREQMIIKDNIINKIKNIIENSEGCKIVGTNDELISKKFILDVLDKIKELENATL